MQRLIIYSGSLSVGIIGFVLVALAGIIVLQLVQPTLTYAVTGATAVLAIASTTALMAIAKKATAKVATAMAGAGIVSLVLTQVVYWKLLIH